MFVLALALSAGAFAQSPPARSTGQRLYLPIYSHIWHGDAQPGSAPSRTLMSVSVSIRNTDLTRPIRVSSAVYYDTHGKLRFCATSGPAKLSGWVTMRSQSAAARSRSS